MLRDCGRWMFRFLCAVRTGIAALSILSIVVAGCATDAPPTVRTPPAQAHPTQQPITKQPPTQQPAAVAPPPTLVHAIDPAQAGYCVDELLADFGVRDVTLLVEDLADPDWRVGVGNRQLLVAVLTEITQRSHAIRLVVSSQDWQNTARLIADVAKREPFGTVPQYALRGTLFRQDTDRAIGVDMSLIATDKMQPVARTASRTIVRLIPEQRALVRRHGQTFSVAASDDAQAVRQLVMLSSIELIGRLARVPYWQCLGLDDNTESVRLEQQDWYDRMAAEPRHLIHYFQQQLRLRGAYSGALDGTVSDEFKQAVSTYRSQLGLSAEPQLSLDFFGSYLSADHDTVVPMPAPDSKGASLAQSAPRPVPTTTRTQTAAQPKPAPSPATKAEVMFLPPRSQPVTGANALSVRAPITEQFSGLDLTLTPTSPVDRLTAGQPIIFTVQPSRTAHVYCFLRDENHRIMRFFPSRFQFDSRVTPTGVTLPGAVPYQIQMNRMGTPEMITCFATETDVLPHLSGGLNSGDLTPLPAKSITQLRDAFRMASGGQLAQQTLLLRSN